MTWFDRLTDMTDENVDWVIHVNLMGTLYCMQAFLPDMIEAGDGHIVATASNAGLISGWVPYHVPYSTAKAGIIAMMLNLRQELEGTGVGSTVYCPGGVRSSLGSDNQKYRPDRFGGPSDGPITIDMNWSRQNIIGSFEPEDVGPMVMHAVKNDTPIVVDHANQRQYYVKYNLHYALTAFDNAREWEQTLPRLQQERVAASD